MGNRFREKTVEEGLDGDVAREALKEAVERSGKRSGNRRRRHEETESIEWRVERGESKAEPIQRTKGNRRRRHEEEEIEEQRVEKETEEAKNVEQREESAEEEIKSEENKYASDEVEEKVTTNLSNGRGSRVARGVAKVLGGDILADKLVLRQIPLLLLCMVFLLLLVANRYQVESLSRKKMAMQERVNELREQQIQIQKKNQNSERISQIRDDLQREKNLGILPTPPNVI